MVWFPVARNPDLLNNYDYYLDYSSKASLSTEARSLGYNVGSRIMLPLYFGLSYFVTPIPTMTFYFNYTDFTEWNYLGAYNFPILSKLINLYFEEPYSWLQIRGKLSVPLVQMGYSDNPWATGIRDLIIDFGIWGTLLFITMFGYFAQYYFFGTLEKFSMEKVLILTLIEITIITFGFFGSLFSGYLQYSIILIIVIMTLKKLPRLIPQYTHYLH